MAPAARNSSRCRPACPWGPPGPPTPSAAGQGGLCHGEQPHQHLGWAGHRSGRHPAPAHNTVPAPEAARRQRMALPKFSTRTRPGAGSLPQESCSPEAGAGEPGWSRAGHTGPVRRVSSASGVSACLWLGGVDPLRGENEGFGRSQRVGPKTGSHGGPTTHQPWDGQVHVALTSCPCSEDNGVLSQD